MCPPLTVISKQMTENNIKKNPVFNENHTDTCFPIVFAFLRHFVQLHSPRKQRAFSNLGPHFSSAKGQCDAWHIWEQDLALLCAPLWTRFSNHLAYTWFGEAAKCWVFLIALRMGSGFANPNSSFRKSFGVHNGTAGP